MWGGPPGTLYRLLNVSHAGFMYFGKLLLHSQGSCANATGKTLYRPVQVINQALSDIQTSRKESGSWQQPLCLHLQASAARKPERLRLHYDGVRCLSQRIGGPVPVAERTRYADGTLRKASAGESDATGRKRPQQCAVVLWVALRMRFLLQHGMSSVSSLQWYGVYVSNGTNVSAAVEGAPVGRGSFKSA